MPLSTSVLDHLQSPRNVGRIDGADAIGRSSCDGQPPSTVIYLAIRDGCVLNARFETFGCGFSIAACSILTELIIGRSVVAGFPLTAEEISQHLAGLPEHKKYCVGLAIDALVDAIYGWRNKQATTTKSDAL